MKVHSRITKMALNPNYPKIYSMERHRVDVHVNTFKVEEVHLHESGYFVTIAYYIKDTCSEDPWNLTLTNDSCIVRIDPTVIDMEDTWAELIKKETSKLYPFSKLIEKINEINMRHKNLVKKLIR